MTKNIWLNVFGKRQYHKNVSSSLRFTFICMESNPPLNILESAPRYEELPSPFQKCIYWVYSTCIAWLWSGLLLASHWCALPFLFLWVHLHTLTNYYGQRALLATKSRPMNISFILLKKSVCAESSQFRLVLLFLWFCKINHTFFTFVVNICSQNTLQYFNWPEQMQEITNRL